MYFLIALFALILSWLMMNWLISPAKKMNLMDHPDGCRKIHLQSTPLVGGICIFTSFIITMLMLQHLTKIDYTPFLLCLFILIILGMLDDFKNISFGFRLVIQAFIAVIMFSTADNGIFNLGNLVNIGDINTGDWALPITILAILSGVNALNMMDGIDGLASLLSLITLVSLLLLFGLNNHNSALIVIICAAIMPIFIANLSLLGESQKLFLGDAGSIGLGFVIVWLLIDGAQKIPEQVFRPITAVWLFAIPLMDMTAIAIRRLSKGKSPFTADRDHLHHFCQRCGFNDKISLIIIGLVHLCFAIIGIITHYLDVPEFVLFYSFIALFGCYYYMMRHAWLIAKMVRKSKLILWLKQASHSNPSQ